MICQSVRPIPSGTLMVNGQEYTGEAPGPYVGLDLVDNLYVGAVPDFTALPTSAGFDRGFVGERFC